MLRRQQQQRIRYREVEATVYDPDRGSSTAPLQQVCEAYAANGGFVGPWSPASSPPPPPHH
jgi:hypothetical protein